MASSTLPESPAADTYDEDEDFSRPPVSPAVALKAAVVRVSAAAAGGAALGGVLGFGLGTVVRESSRVTMRESAFGLKTVALMSAVYAATSAAIENIRNDLLNSAKPGLAGCAAGLAATVPGGPTTMLQGCAAFGLAAFVLDYFLPAEASAITHATRQPQSFIPTKRGLFRNEAQHAQIVTSLFSLAVPAPKQP
eukprot:TRINITY_DN14501_c0_g1_i1.p1 TRINITY_DN14501_c0_g1~~TRINITY_DN14501_c0_g1_i1.p1  ORF type:complete len:194 (-),score=15.45 TRINITY_DN14501_c0_g1_i1:60-641(-)